MTALARRRGLLLPDGRRAAASAPTTKAKIDKDKLLGSWTFSSKTNSRGRPPPGATMTLCFPRKAS